MARSCYVCSKQPRVGNIVSHANNKTRRVVFPNVHTIRFTYAGQASIKRAAVCTKCVKAGKVVKVI